MALALAEYLALSFLVDLPTGGEAARLAGLARLLVPVALGAGAASWLLSRTLPRPPPPPLPPWRPARPLAANLLAFAATAGLAWHTLGPGATPPSAAALLLLLAAAGGTLLLALAVAAPLGWLLRALLPGAGAAALALLAGIATWGATAAAEGAWGLLSAATLRTVAGLLRLGGGRVTLVVEERAVGLDGFEVEVSPECSGIDGIGLVVLFQALWLALARGRIRLPRALLLLPAGAAAAFGANALRLAALLWTGAAGHPEVALGGLHSKLGWLLFLGLALGSVAVVEHLPALRRPGAAAEDVPRAAAGGAALPDEAAPCLLPLLATMAAALVTATFAGGALDRWYAVRVAVGLAAVALGWRALPRLIPSRSWLPAAAGLVVGAAWVLLGPAGPGGLGEELAGLAPAGRSAWIGARLAGALLAIPLVEELAFRGFLLPWLAGPAAGRRRAAALLPAVAISSLAFGAVHAEWLLGTAAGAAFAAVRLWRGRVGDAVVAHAAANAVVAAAALSGRWALWG